MNVSRNPDLQEDPSDLIYYKYRSVENFKNFVDIIINKRLYAAKFTDLNDPMEGMFYYKKGILTEEQKKEIKNNKTKLRICSLSTIHNNILMWSHYADGHKGVVIGVQIIDSDFPVKHLEYKDPEYFKNKDDIIEGDLLISKIKKWKHEKEVRVFNTKEGNFISVLIKEIYIGSRMSNENECLIRKLIMKFSADNITIKKMSKSTDCWE